MGTLENKMDSVIETLAKISKHLGLGSSREFLNDTSIEERAQVLEFQMTSVSREK